MGSRFFDRIDGIESYEGLSDTDSATGVCFTLAAGKVTMKFLPEEKVAEHLNGFAGFARHVIRDSDQLIYARTRIHCVRLVCGCTITPEFDDEGTLQDFLFRFTAAANGLLFFADTIFDYDGRALGGLHIGDGDS